MGSGPVALVVSLKAGQDFYVGEERFFVSKIHSQTSFSLLHEATNSIYLITESHATQIMQDVFVSAGKKPGSLVARVTVDAPRSLLIMLGDKRRNPAAKHKTGG